MERLQLDPAIVGTLESFDTFVSCDTLCAAQRTIRLVTPPITTTLAGGIVNAGSAHASAHLDPVIRQLGYHCNRLCKAGAPEDEAACAYFLSEGGHLHRIVATPTGGRVEGSAVGLPGWPAEPGPLAALVQVRNKVADNAPCLLACDGSSQLWLCDEAGGTVGGAIPLPLPHGYSATDGWEHWLAMDATWSESSTNSSGRVDCVLLGCRRATTKRWSVLAVSIVLPSATSAPSLNAAALATQAQPLYIRCGLLAGTVHCLLVVPCQWGARRSDSQVVSSANSSAVEEQANGETTVSNGNAEIQLEDVGEDQDHEDEVQGPATIDNYVAVQLQPDASGMQLAVKSRQELDSFRPMVNPDCQELQTGGVLLCTTRMSLSLRHVEPTQPVLVDPHAHVFTWLDSTPQASEVASHSGKPLHKPELLRHGAAIGALGYICSARPQRRFVVLAQQYGFVVVAENKIVTVFACSAGSGGMRSRPPQQVYQLPTELGDLVGLTLVGPPKADASVSVEEGVCSSCSSGSGSSLDIAAVLLVLGVAGVSAVQLRRLPTSPQDPAAQAVTSPATASAASESEEMKALRVRALELLAGDGEW